MLTAFADFFRLMRAAIMLARHDALVPREYAHMAPPLLRIVGTVSRLGARKSDDRPGERMASAFEQLGPAYVKLGQFMATRPDIIGFEMAGDLGRLQDRMPAFSQAEARAEIERAFGKTVDEIFASFSEPVAAASIAQAHKATLKTGEKVAVKILRPRIEKIAADEFRAFSRAAHLVEVMSAGARRLEPVKFIETLKASAAIELDLRLEAGAASEIGDMLADDDSARAPEIVWPFTSKRVLTLDWIDGASLGDIEALDARGIDRKKLAAQVIKLFLAHALQKGFFHADMHQGNLIVDEEGRLVLIDFGIMGRLDEATRRTFAEIIYGFITRNYQRAAQVHFDAGYVGPEHSVEAFAQALRAVGEPLFGRNAASVDMSRVLQQLFDVTDLFDMHLRPELVLLQRTMVTVEGVARTLDPEINMWEEATPIVRAAIADSIGPAAQARKFAEAARHAAEFAPKLPYYLEKLSIAAGHLADDRAGVGGRSRSELAAAISKEGRLTRAALWFAGGAAIILAVSYILN